MPPILNRDNFFERGDRNCHLHFIHSSVEFGCCNAIPCALIGRLAVDQNQQGKGYGKILLVDALKKILALADEIGIQCITIDAKDDNAKKFFKNFGFEELLDEDHHLYISIEKVQNSFS